MFGAGLAQPTQEHFVGDEMAAKRPTFVAAAKRAAGIIQAHLDTLPFAQASAMRKEIHGLAVKASRSPRSKMSRRAKAD
jgi:hypothetical protein